MNRSLFLSASVFVIASRAFMTESVETVLIKTDTGDVLINKSDYDDDQAEGGAKQYTLSTNEKPVVQDAPVLEPSGGNDDGSPSQKLVMKDGKGKDTRFYVVLPDGSKVVDTAGIDNDGYVTEAEAWQAIVAVQTAPPPT